MTEFDVLIIGSGPAGLWAAEEIILAKPKAKVAIIERGTHSSGGLINDCKLNLTPDIGMELDELKITRSQAEEYIKYVDDKFLELGADEQVYGTDQKEIHRWVERAKRCGAQLIACQQRHVGTDMSKHLVERYKEKLEKAGVKFMLNTNVESIGKNGNFSLKTTAGNTTSKLLLVAPGRDGAYWFRSEAAKLGVKYNWGPIDVGVRIELLSEIYDPITEFIYDPKFKFKTKSHRDKTRTFCTNKGGKVRIEPMNGKGFSLINGDALKKVKTENTNFAILNTVGLTEPYADTLEMGREIARETLRLGGGKPIVQRVGDFLEGRRSKVSNFFDPSKGYDLVKPTLPMNMIVPGDISLAYRGRIVDNIRDTLEVLDRIVPGVAHPSTLMYAPEIKFYDTKYPTSAELETDCHNLFIAGDGVGKSRGIVGAALTGVVAGRAIAKRL